MELFYRIKNSLLLSESQFIHISNRYLLVKLYSNEASLPSKKAKKKLTGETEILAH